MISKLGATAGAVVVGTGGYFTYQSFEAPTQVTILPAINTQFAEYVEKYGK